MNRLGSATETNVDGTSTYWLRGFQYDQYGNMWTSVNGGVPTWSMMPTSNVFNSANQITGGSYDGAGNQTAIGPYTLQYDAENRLIQASQPTSAGGGQVQYGYDAEGKRITKSFLSGPSTVYVYDVFGSLAAEYSSAPLTTAPVCGTCYLSTDHLGSTRLVTGENGSVMARHDYLPFGEEIPSGYANRGADWAADDSVKQKFTGQERDSETQLDFFQARYFTAAQGRFNSPDPMNAGADPANPQSWNAYAYVNNNPMNATDPTGMCPPGSENNCIDVDGGSADPLEVWDSCFLCFYDPGSSGGGGGGDYTFSVTKVERLAQVPPAAQKAVKQAPQTCLVAIGGSKDATVDLKRLSRTAAAIHWYDGRVLPATQFPNIPRSATANATTVPKAGNIPTPNVILWSEFWNETFPGQLKTLWHEITHVHTKLDDARLVDRFEILNKKNPWGLPYPQYLPDSQNYDDWLNRDQCP